MAHLDEPQEAFYRDAPAPAEDTAREATWEERGRAEKVRRLVESLDAAARSQGLCPTADAEAIARSLRPLTDSQWHKIQHEAGMHRKTPPSRLTRDAVIQTYELRVDRAKDEA